VSSSSAAEKHPTVRAMVKAMTAAVGGSPDPIVAVTVHEMGGESMVGPWQHHLVRIAADDGYAATVRLDAAGQRPALVPSWWRDPLPLELSLPWGATFAPHFDVLPGGIHRQNPKEIVKRLDRARRVDAWHRQALARPAAERPRFQITGNDQNRTVTVGEQVTGLSGATGPVGGLLVHVTARALLGQTALQLFLITEDGSHREHAVAGHPANL
jgi:hypothetical protein